MDNVVSDIGSTTEIYQQMERLLSYDTGLMCKGGEGRSGLKNITGEVRLSATIL